MSTSKIAALKQVILYICFFYIQVLYVASAKEIDNFCPRNTNLACPSVRLFVWCKLISLSHELPGGGKR